MSARPRILFCCTGVGILNRGIESFFREAFDGLKDAMPDLDVWLLKGAGPAGDRERAVACLPRTGRAAAFLGRLINRNAYVAEQLSSFPAVAAEIRRWRPDVIFYSDSNLGFQLFRWRRAIGVPYRLLFSNGGPVSPPFVRTDFVQQVAPFYLEQALAAGESPNRHFLVPYGIAAGSPPRFDRTIRRALREKLGLPPDRPVVLSVGWISREHKRMDYVIEEMARLPQPRPFLQLLGALDENSPEIVELGRRLLGPENFSVASVPYPQVGDYYQAADCFVLASLREGFGRVYLEALRHGLPVVAHRHPVIEYVVGSEGRLGDLRQEGALAALVVAALQAEPHADDAARRWQSVRDRFDWSVLAPAYAAMFHRVAGLSI